MVHKIDTSDMISCIDTYMSKSINWIIIQIGLIFHASNEPQFIRIVYIKVRKKSPLQKPDSCNFTKLLFWKHKECFNFERRLKRNCLECFIYKNKKGNENERNIKFPRIIVPHGSSSRKSISFVKNLQMKLSDVTKKSYSSIYFSLSSPHKATSQFIAFTKAKVCLLNRIRSS